MSHRLGFGNIKHTLSAIFFSPYTYTGREWDEESHLYYYRARFYDPSLGGFLSADPYNLSPAWLTLYMYCLNNPRNWNDPHGLYLFPIPIPWEPGFPIEEFPQYNQLEYPHLLNPELRKLLEKLVEIESEIADASSEISSSDEFLREQAEVIDNCRNDAIREAQNDLFDKALREMHNLERNLVDLESRRDNLNRDINKLRSKIPLPPGTT